MKFTVQDYGHDFSLGEFAIEKHWWIHQRTFATMAEFDRKFGEREGLWRSKGQRHKLIKCVDNRPCIYREELREVHIAEFATLVDLSKFLQESAWVVRCSDYADVPLEVGPEREG